MKCGDLHIKIMLLDPNHLEREWEWEVKYQMYFCYKLNETCRSAHKDHLSSPQSRSGSLIKNLLLGIVRTYTHMHILVFLLVLYSHPNPTPWGRTRNMTFLYRSAHFMQFLAIFCFWYLTLSPPHGVGG